MIRPTMLLCVMLLGLLLASQSHAATLTMTPGESFSSKLVQLHAGDTLYLHAGVYTQVLDLCEGCYPHLSGTAGQRTTIAAAPGETVTLRPGNAGSVVRFAGTVAVPYRYITVDRLHIDATGGGYGISWSFTYAEHIRVQNGEIFGGSMSGISGMSPYGEVVGNAIHHNGNDRLSHGLYICPTNGRIMGNNVYANSGYGIQLYAPTHAGCASGTVLVGNHVHDNLGDGGVVLSSGTNIRFCGNTVERNHGGGVRPICYGGVGSVQVVNNTIVENDGEAVNICAGVPGTQVRDNLLRGNAGEVNDQGQGSVVAGNGAQARGAQGASCAVGLGDVPSETETGEAGLPSAPVGTLPVPSNLRLVTVP